MKSLLFVDRRVSLPVRLHPPSLKKMYRVTLTLKFFIYKMENLLFFNKSVRSESRKRGHLRKRVVFQSTVISVYKRYGVFVVITKQTNETLMKGK